MLDKARQRLQRLPGEAQRRVTLVQADGENADEAVNGRRFAAVLCHGVLGYLEQPEPLVNQLCRCAAAGGVVSIMTGNAKAMAVRPALERRWDDALAAFDARAEIGVLGVPGRADTVEELSELMRSRGVEPLRWYGVWLFVDWLEFSGAELDPSDSKQVAATAAVELEASRRDPYRQLSRVFHLVGRKGPGGRDDVQPCDVIAPGGQLEAAQDPRRFMLEFLRCEVSLDAAVRDQPDQRHRDERHQRRARARRSASGDAGEVDAAARACP